MPQPPVDVRAVNGSMAPRAPTRASAHERGVRNIADVNVATRRVHLGVAFETKIVVALDEHLIGD